MGALVGVVIGYVLGTRAGEKGYDEFRSAWKTITSSDEVKDLAGGGLSLARDLLRRGRGSARGSAAVRAGTLWSLTGRVTPQ